MPLFGVLLWVFFSAYTLIYAVGSVPVMLWSWLTVMVAGPGSAMVKVFAVVSIL
ncbi:hypothetical protein [uncultured Microbulbifer sp.]|uniref:hypothetical protein n=1 Tax=uncultured Microbulbifer sp. TaxID=348147 RepID=UPI002636DC6A|nr:hypothetical protein [uncultured Microbulbifer sp.]